MNKYLPSKKFIVSTAVLIGIAVLVFGIYEIVNFLSHRSGRMKFPTKVEIANSIQKDSNNNGIPDWEESLWGLDPTKNGQSNKDFIIAKRDILSKNSSVIPATKDIPTATVDLSKEFFSVVMSLQQSNTLDDSSMQSIADVVGQKVVAAPIDDVYTADMVSAKRTTPTTLSNYYYAFKKLTDKYADKDIGNELTYISQGLKNNDAQAFQFAGDIASAYRLFGKELIKIPVPDSLISVHVSLANNYEKVAKSIEGIDQSLTDPITGMKAIINYKKYTDALVANIQQLSDSFK